MTAPPANRDARRRLAVTIAVVAFASQLVVQAMLRPVAIEGMYFHAWSSEALMQTVPMEDLMASPFTTLWHIHIQPPVFDVVRALFAHTGSARDTPAAIRHVDQALYVVWAAAYAALGVLIFLWLSRLTDLRTGLIAAGLFLCHPASIYYATFLDTTLLSSALILLMYYLLWQLADDTRRSVTPFAISVVALFYTRAIFQWPAVWLLAASLVLLGLSRRAVVAYLLVAASLTGVYVVKQSVQFGLFTTASFTGLNLAHSIGVPRAASYEAELAAIPESPATGRVRVLTRKWKSNGALNYDRIDQLAVDRRMTGAYFDAVRRRSAGDLLHSYAANAWIYFKPSDQYHAHVIVDRLPWRGLFDAIFSFPLLPTLIAGAGARCAWRRRREWRRTAALLLPALFVFAICMLFEKTENMRYKFFLEPVMFVFIVAEGYDVFRRGKQPPSR